MRRLELALPRPARPSRRRARRAKFLEDPTPGTPPHSVSRPRPAPPRRRRERQPIDPSTTCASTLAATSSPSYESTCLCPSTSPGGPRAVPPPPPTDHPHEHARSSPSVNSLQHEAAPISRAVLGGGHGLGGEGRCHGFVLVLVLVVVLVCKLGASLSGEGATCRVERSGRCWVSARGRGLSAARAAASCWRRRHRRSGACACVGRSCSSTTTGEQQLTARSGSHAP